MRRSLLFQQAQTPIPAEPRQTACQLLVEGAPQVEDHQLHRLHKADTTRGLDSVRGISGMGVPYAMLLYERFLGRPFAGHRDSVSELVGDPLESAIEEVLVLRQPEKDG